MLDQVGAEEDLVRRAGGLADARKMRDAIVVVLALLGELDELMPDEPDRSAFHEIADLFQDVFEFAAWGGAADRRAGRGTADVPPFLRQPTGPCCACPQVGRLFP